VVPHGRAIAQRIKATPGITGLSPPRGADSNTSIYDYDRNIYTAGIEYRF